MNSSIVTSVLARVLALAALVAAGCEDEPPLCYYLEPAEGLHVALHSETWAEGSYAIVADDDRRSTSCVVSLVRDADGSITQTSDSECTSTSMDASADEWLLTLSNGALVLELRDAPRNVRLRVTRDGTLLHDASYTPSYEESEPSGRGCGVVLNADLTVQLP